MNPRKRLRSVMRINQIRHMRYLQHYPAALMDHAQTILGTHQVGEWFKRKYPERHHVQTDKALYRYVSGIQERHLKHAPALNKVTYDSNEPSIQGSLGTNTFVSRVQGGKLKAKHEIRVATLLRDAPLSFLRMVVVHELAHLKEKPHNKAFYKLCCHMEPNYHQLELEMRVWLICRESRGRSDSRRTQE